MSTCECKPGEDILFGPGMERTSSYVLEVTTLPIHIVAIDLPDDACVEILRVTTTCEGEITSPVKDGCCCCTTICGCDCEKTLIYPGKYKAVLTGAEADEALVTWRHIEAPVTFTVPNGDNTMGCNCGMSVSDVKAIVEACISGIGSSPDTNVTIAPSANGIRVTPGNGGSPYDVPISHPDAPAALDMDGLIALIAGASPAQRAALAAELYAAEGSGWINAAGQYGENDALRGTPGYTSIDDI